ncbi:MAG: hypothetical protein JWR24_3333 [Actinoallomurus sp.]|jgi:hypothetical protein|nr:hypothetical protein [Actinoallomurus sp.]
MLAHRHVTGAKWIGVQNGHAVLKAGAGHVTFNRW